MAGGVSRWKRERRRGRRQQEKEKAPLVTKERETDVEIGEAKNNTAEEKGHLVGGDDRVYPNKLLTYRLYC